MDLYNGELFKNHFWNCLAVNTLNFYALETRQRKGGYYWVKRNGFAPEIVYCWGRCFTLGDTEKLYYEKDFAYISPEPLQPPTDLQPQPTTDEMPY